MTDSYAGNVKFPSARKAFGLRGAIVILLNVGILTVNLAQNTSLV